MSSNKHYQLLFLAILFIAFLFHLASFFRVLNVLDNAGSDVDLTKLRENMFVYLRRYREIMKAAGRWPIDYYGYYASMAILFIAFISLCAVTLKVVGALGEK